jgi:uncharacterized membrane protein YGL010W
MPITVPSQYETLSAMITPAIFMTANASLIISTSNRMARIVDRIRALNDLVDKLDGNKTDLDYIEDRMAHLQDQFRRLGWRGDRIRFALIALYVALALFLGTSLTLAIDALVANRLVALPIMLAVAGVGLLLFACVNLVLEALEALRSNRLASTWSSTSVASPLGAARTRGRYRRVEVGRSATFRHDGAHPWSRCYDPGYDGIPHRMPFARRGARKESLAMMSLKQQMQSYGAYHKDPRNKMTHFVGVPLVTFSLFLALGWFRFVRPDILPITAATLFYLGVVIYYLRLDWAVALMQLPITLTLLMISDWVARLPFSRSFSLFLATFVLGSIIQLVGHAIEGRRPALADNILQVFNAPLFLTIEVLAALKLRKDLYESENLNYSHSPT